VLGDALAAALKRLFVLLNQEYVKARVECADRNSGAHGTCADHRDTMHRLGFANDCGRQLAGFPFGLEQIALRLDSWRQREEDLALALQCPVERQGNGGNPIDHETVRKLQMLATPRLVLRGLNRRSDLDGIDFTVTGAWQGFTPIGMCASDGTSGRNVISL
jgi:hypothetical protein